MKTPMQEHIEWLKKEWKKLESAGEIGIALNIGDCIEHAESMLDKEKSVIMDAYTAGESDATHKMDSALNYYNETFNTNQKNLPNSTNGYTYYPQERKITFNTKEK